MKNITSTKLIRIVGLLLFCRAAEFSGAAVTEPPYPKTNLISFLAQWKSAQAHSGILCELEPQWVGTVKRVYLRGGEETYKEDKPNNIRFSHLMVLKKLNKRAYLSILRGRLTAQGKIGSYTGGEAPVFTSDLPSTKAVSEAKNVDDLHKMFGPQQGFTDGWSIGGRMHWTEGWTLFTVETDGRLRYLGISAHVSSASHEKPADIDILHVTEGFFHSANPNSDVEQAEFKTGEELHAEYEATRIKVRAKYPLPLRSLVEAKETPDDSDLLAYKRALNEVRRNPKPELFRQFAEWIHEGTREMKVMLENILFDDFLDLKKWEEPKRKIALRALADALPHVKTNSDLDDLVALLLQANGGGRLKLAVSGTSGVFDVAVQRSSDGKGYTLTFSSQNISSENLMLAAEQCRDALKKQFP